MKTISLAILLAGVCSAQIPTANLQVGWAYSDGAGTTVTDSSGNGRNGTLSGSSLPVWIKGNGIDCGGAAFSLPGYVAGPSLNLTGNRSAAILFNLSIDTGSDAVLLLGSFDPNVFNGWGIGVNQTSSNVVEYYAGPTWSAGSKNVNDQKWHDLLISENGGTTKLYVDGTLDATWTVANPSNYAGPLAVCSRSTGTLTSTTQVAGLYIWNVPEDANVAAIHAVLATQAANLNEYPASPVVPFPPSVMTQPSNGLTPNPPMEWNSWYCSLYQGACQRNGSSSGAITDAEFRVQCAKLISLGLTAAGYNTCDLTEPGNVARTPAGGFVSHRFPNYTGTAAAVHTLGEKFGNYTAMGRTTCEGFFGMFGNETADAVAYKAMGADQVQTDFCSAQADYASQISTYGQAATMQQIYQYQNQQWIASGAVPQFGLLHNDPSGLDWIAGVGGNFTRYNPDTEATWAGLDPDFDNSANLIASPSQLGSQHWPLLDILGIGAFTMTVTEGNTEFALAAVLGSALQISMDLTTIRAGDLTTISNREVIAVNQDPGHLIGYRATTAACGSASCEAWVRQLTSGATQSWAVMLVNRSSTTQTISTTWSAISTALSGRSPAVTFQTTSYPYCRDIENHVFVGTQNTSSPGGGWGSLATGYSASVPSHGVAMIVISNTAPPAPTQMMF